MHNVTSPSSENSAAEQMENILAQLSSLLIQLKIDSRSIIFSTLLLKSMSDFGPVNAVYSKLFTKPLPPARVTIACPLPEGVLVAWSIIIDKLDSHTGLHVQSRSYWAPANIGPYSQAISAPLSLFSNEDQLVYVAGQIPLVPASMEVMHNQGADDAWQLNFHVERACLSLQHMWRIGHEMRVDAWSCVAAFVAGRSAHSKAEVAWRTWEQFHQRDVWDDQSDQSDDDVDVWHMKNARSTIHAIQEDQHQLPNFAKMVQDQAVETVVPGFIAVNVKSLPRDCDIEWQGLGVKCTSHEFVEESLDGMGVSTCHFRSSASYVALVRFPILPGMDLLAPRVERALKWILEKTRREEALETEFPLLCTLYSPSKIEALSRPVQVVPCYDVWGSRAERLAGAMTVQYETSSKGGRPTSESARILCD